MENLTTLSGIDGLSHIDIAGVGTLVVDGVGHVEDDAAALGLAAGQIDDRLAELDLDVADIEVGPSAASLSTTDGDIATGGVVDVSEGDIELGVFSAAESDALDNGEGGGIHIIGKVAYLEGALGGAIVVSSLEAHLDGVECEAHLGKDNHAVGAVDIHAVISSIYISSTASLGPAAGQTSHGEGLDERHVSRSGGGLPATA